MASAVRQLKEVKALKFSILVPVYNVEKYLEQCVDSLLNQTYQGEYEIVLVDDGSTDSSGLICERYVNDYPDRIKVIHKKNEGLVSARQVGIENASGEYSLFVDSDDFVELNLLESINNALEHNPKTDIVVFNMNYFNDETKSVYARRNRLHRRKQNTGLRFVVNHAVCDISLP